MKSAEKLLLLFVCAMASVAAAAAPSRDASRLLEARRIAICPASSTGFCARARDPRSPTREAPHLIGPFRKECFAKWGGYSLDYGMYGNFELR